MDFEQTISILNGLLADKNPAAFSSSWILKHAPHCYRFIQKYIRTELGHIDWDTVTCALNKKFQRRWAPIRKPKSRGDYEDPSEVNVVLNNYQEKLYVFIAPTDQHDRRIRDMISISLVRLAQHGNMAAKQEVLKLVGYTIEDWVSRYNFMFRWRGYNEKSQNHLEACIRRYRYTGSFIRYVFSTLQYAGRGLPPMYEYSLDDPIAVGSERCKIENVFKDSVTNEIRIYKRTDHGISGIYG